MPNLTWHRLKGISGLYADLDDEKRRYDITISDDADGYDLSLYDGNRHRHLGRYSKQVDAKKAAEALSE